MHYTVEGTYFILILVCLFNLFAFDNREKRETIVRQ